MLAYRCCLIIWLFASQHLFFYLKKITATATTKKVLLKSFLFDDKIEILV